MRGEMVDCLERFSYLFILDENGESIMIEIEEEGIGFAATFQSLKKMKILNCGVFVDCSMTWTGNTRKIIRRNILERRLKF